MTDDQEARGPGGHVDDILEVIDVGLQTAGDASYGRLVPEGACWRCCKAPADPSSSAGVCGTCREVLLADPFPSPVTSGVRVVQVTISISFARVEQAMRDMEAAIIATARAQHALLEARAEADEARRRGR